MTKFRVEIDYLVEYEPANSTVILYVEAEDHTEAFNFGLDWFRDVKRKENFKFRLPLIDVKEL